MKPTAVRYPKLDLNSTSTPNPASTTGGGLLGAHLGNNNNSNQGLVNSHGTPTTSLMMSSGGTSPGSAGTPSMNSSGKWGKRDLNDNRNSKSLIKSKFHQSRLCGKFQNQMQFQSKSANHYKTKFKAMKIMLSKGTMK